MPDTTAPPSTEPATEPSTEPPTTAPSTAISIKSFAYSPNPITVAPGTTVTVTNNDGVAHTWTADGGAFDSGSIAPGASYSFTFTGSGTFAYHCSIHYPLYQSMHGTVTVT